MKLLKITDATQPNAKNKYFIVESTVKGGVIGSIKWLNYWQAYCFYPTRKKTVILNTACLDELAAFIENIGE